MDELVADKSRSFFTIVGEQDQALGWLCLMEAKPDHRTIELGYVTFAPSLRRTTLATEAFYLIMTLIFDDLAYARLEWTCTAENERSQNAARRLGFKYEGTMRSKVILKDRTRNVALYSMLAEEWPSVRAAMQKWLAPANFRNGKQIKALVLPS
jgi:RimJ/RimL family protein N-acetyltransferase